MMNGSGFPLPERSTMQKDVIRTISAVEWSLFPPIPIRQSLFFQKKEATTKLGVKEIDSSELVVVCYKEGAVFFDTSSSDSDHYERFKVNGSLSYNALATYAFDYYKVEK